MNRRLKPDQVDYWEGALQLLFYNLFLKVTTASEVHEAQVLPDPDCGSKNLLCPLNQWCSITFVL